MKTYRAVLLGSVALGLVSYQAYSRDLLPAQFASKHTGDSAIGAAIQLAAAEAGAATEEPASPPANVQGVTSFYGDGQTPDAGKAWSEPASMNPDYTAEAAAPEPTATAAETPAATTDAPASPGGAGVTSYYGDGQSPDADKPWAAPATPNPDYTADAPSQVPAAAEAPPAQAQPAEAAPAAPAAAAEEPAPPATGGQGVTSYYGDGQTPDAGKPWSAEATMNPDNATPAAKPASTCAEALNTEARAGKITFEMSSWDITSESFKTLDKISKLAKDCSGVMIEIGGHTDNTGKPASNQTISELRAKAVMRYLVHEGVDASKLKAVGYGQDKPIGDNSTSEGRAENRRIEFSVTAN